MFIRLDKLVVRFSSFHILQSVNLHQPTLVLIATSQQNAFKTEEEIMKYQIQGHKLNNYLRQKKFRMQKHH